MSREKNRQEFPQVAAMVDEVRRYFPNARLIHGEENGREIGQEPEYFKTAGEFLGDALAKLGLSRPQSRREVRPGRSRGHAKAGGVPRKLAEKPVERRG